jgi:hypothetical protein
VGEDLEPLGHAADELFAAPLGQQPARMGALQRAEQHELGAQQAHAVDRLGRDGAGHLRLAQIHQ